ncbi:uncharacterized protein LOC116197379 [Punica granatum]|uniref:RRM domain-containing protein n=2 Tax=Punica granatum TaxID=22663 RepID=A0A218WNJ9_PUNGR|nr:uncharacterized protein LOC116197379 [Punica granatum]OWM74414.1 hypothetical protein CDL15_Pgr013318 [Punica granatum]PKI73673.1 hypothetical protein CRG98_005914 [Punica granatum]
MKTGVSSFVTQDEFNLFHSIDRSLYTVLVINLFRDPTESMRVIAMFLWLEHKGFRYCVKKILSFPHVLINEIAEEAVTCLNIIDNKNQSCIASSSSGISDIPVMQSILSQELSPRFFHENRVSASEGIARINNSVCMRALSDIMEKAVASKASRDSSIDDRTLFITFSKGYPVQEWEIRDFFTKTNGNCVESVYMQEVKPNEQSLFARIVFRTASSVGHILNGTSRAKFTINGKHAWARKYVPKRSKVQHSTTNNLPSQFPYIV